MAIDYADVGNSIETIFEEVPNVLVSYTTNVTGKVTYDPATGASAGGTQTGSFRAIYLGEIRGSKPSAESNAGASMELITMRRFLVDNYQFNSSTIFVVDGIEWSFISYSTEPSGNALFLKVGRLNG